MKQCKPLLLGSDDPLEKFDSLMKTTFLSSTESQLWVTVLFGVIAADDGVGPGAWSVS